MLSAKAIATELKELLIYLFFIYSYAFRIYLMLYFSRKDIVDVNSTID